MESDLRKGYRGAAERSSNVGVPEWLSMESDLRKGYRGAAELSSNVGVPAFRAGQPRDRTEEVGVPGWFACRARG